MFKSNQIIPATKLMKNFRYFAQRLKREPQSLLITQKGNKSLVLVNAEMFEDLVEFQCQAMSAGFRPVDNYYHEELLSDPTF